MRIITGADLDTADLILDAIYRGYPTENGGITDPLVRMVGVSRQGGFRYRGKRQSPTLLVLTSNLSETEWPDELDPALGQFVYWGDNRRPGHQLHDTPRFGNQLLRDVFDHLHSGRRHLIPPILVFTKESPGRAFKFRGLAVPGYPSLPATDDLVAVWKTVGDERFQNYRAIFTIIDVAVVDRRWIYGLRTGANENSFRPAAFSRWVKSGVAKPLLAPRANKIRSKEEQLPTTDADKSLIDTIKSRFRENPIGFEVCAAEISKILLPGITSLDLTRPWKDGGRDGIGTVQLGHAHASIDVNFALEAKCFSTSNSVGVREVSRLISRIKHREFGILVTTSFIDTQAYKEVTDDAHPVIFVTATDIVRLLKEAGYHSVPLLTNWLDGIDVLNS